MSFRDLFKKKRTKDNSEVNVSNPEYNVKRAEDSPKETMPSEQKVKKIKKVTGPRIIFQSKSPSCNINAIVEENDECVYFELIGKTPQGPFIKSCWIRNYKKAPREMQPRIKENGESTMLAGMYCKEPEGSPKIYAANLEIIWLEEGDGAALLYNGEIICVITNDTYDQCPGYSRDCTAPTSFAWPLGSDVEDNMIIKRVRKAQEFWENWDDNTWSDAADEYVKSIEENIGEEKEIYSIDGKKWPPKILSLIEKGDTTYVFTVGVSLRPQPKVQRSVSNPADYRRFEIGFAIKTEILEKNKEDILQYISNVTCLPWVNIGWLGNGHTIRCNVLNSEESKFNNVLFLNNMFVVNGPDIKFKNYRGDRVNFLWLIPLTDKEEEICEKEGSAKLFERVKENNENLIVFTGESKFNIEDSETVEDEAMDEAAAAKE